MRDLGPDPPDPADAPSYAEARRQYAEWAASLTKEQHAARDADAEAWANRILEPLFTALDDMQARLEEHTGDDEEPEGR